MLVTWLRIAWPNFHRNKLFTLVSMSGLAFGSTACLLIWLICSYEFSFDNSYPNRDAAFRVSTLSSPKGRSPWAWGVPTWIP